MIPCASLHLSLSHAVWSLSEDIHSVFLSVSTVEYHSECQKLVLVHGIHLELVHLLFVNSLDICSICPCISY